MDWYKAFDGKLSTTLFSQKVKPFLQKVKVNGRDICLIGHDGDVFAVGAECPHAGADLSWGKCVNGKLICPYHRYEYDIKTGKGDPGQNDYIDTYPVEVRADGVYIGMQSFADKVKTMFK